MVGGPRSSSPLSLSSPPLVLVSSLASSSLLCFASCPLFADFFFHFFHAVYSRSRPRSPYRPIRDSRKTERLSKVTVESNNRRDASDKMETKTRGSRCSQKTYTRMDGRNQRDDSPQPSVFFGYLSIRHRGNNGQGAGREVSGGAMTTTPRRWMHSLLQRDRTLPQTRFPLSRYAASLSWKKKSNDSRMTGKVRRKFVDGPEGLTLRSRA